MSKLKITNAIGTICEMMQETDSNEFVIEVGLNGGNNDGARFLVHVLRQCLDEPTQIEVQLQDDDDSENED